MPDTAPALNEYKIVFFRKRWLQTLLGGVDLKIHGEVSFTIYVFQLILLLFPAVSGIIATILVALLDPPNPLIADIAFGGIICALTLCFSVFVARKGANQVSPFGKQSKVADLFAEEDQHDFDSVCQPDALHFLIPSFLFPHTIIQAVLNGLLCGYALVFLAPSRLQDYYSGDGVWVITVLGWITVTLALYSMIGKSPPEPSQFRSFDQFSLQRFSRPFYILLFFEVDALEAQFPQLAPVNQVLRIVFLFLPLLWAVGFLPQSDVLILWTIEQLQIFAFGGSATINDSRTLANFMFSLIAAAVVCFLYGFVRTGWAFAAGTFLGFILSADLIPFVPTPNAVKLKDEPKLFFGRFPRNLFIHSIIAVVLGAGTGLLQMLAVPIQNISISLDAILTLLLVIVWATSAFQRSFFFNLIGNPIYPDLKPWQQTLQRVCGLTYRYSSLLSSLCIWLYYSTSFTEEDFTQKQPAWVFVQGVLTLRAFRWAWQMPEYALFETVVFGWIQQISSISPSLSSPQLRLFILALLHDRLWDFAGKTYYVLISIITSLLSSKLAFKWIKPVHTIQLIFFPIVLAVILLSVITTAPLIPFLGLPIFILAFPRPLRMWPKTGESASISEDTILYEQLVPQVVKKMTKLFENGALGAAAPGSVYLLRFESRIVWLEVIEQGYGYRVLVVKGLELQETSCHHVEAGVIDEIFKQAGLEGDTQGEKKSWNHFFYHTLSPIVRFPVETYSISRMVLTGIIDHPDNLRSLTNYFWKTLVWVLLRKAPQPIPERWTKMAKAVNSHSNDIFQQFPKDWYNMLKGGGNINMPLGKDQLVMVTTACYSIIEVCGLGGMDIIGAGSRHVYDVFQGSIPTSLEAEWLTNDDELKKIVITAYRLAFKLMFDSVVYGSIDSLEELKDQLEEYENTWFLGTAGDEMRQHIESGRENLFTMSVQDGVYAGYSMKMGERVIAVGQMNRQVINGIWASLNLELLYITNDDDERYSIQAHPQLLRNVTVQSSEPPLGYPCYAATVEITHSL